MMTYYGKDSPVVSQELAVRGTSRLIHSKLAVPSGSPVSNLFPVPGASVDSGNLQLTLTSVEGPRALVSGVLLLKQQANDNTAPSIVIDTPVEKQRVPAGQLVISGQVTDDSGSVDRIEIGYSRDGINWQWFNVDALTSAGNWHYVRTINQSGSVYFSARAWDSSGNFAQLASPVQILADVELPVPVTGLVAGSDSDGDGDGVRLQWQSKTEQTDLKYYRLLRSLSLQAEFQEVAIIPLGIRSHLDYSVISDNSYYYRIESVDLTGNSALSAITGPVLFSGQADEVAPENVTGLTAAISYSGSGNGVIYYRWQPSANTAGDLAGYRVQIKEGETVVNTVELSSDQKGYGFTDAEAGQRYQVSIQSRDIAGNLSEGSILSTTVEERTQLISLSGNLMDDLDLPAATYLVNTVTVPTGKTLTLKAGTVLKFKRYQKMNVYGAIVTEGDENNPVVFTSENDDSYGGDTNGDGVSEGTRGYWDRIEVYNNGRASLDNTVVRFGDYSSVAMLYSHRGQSIEVKNSIFEESKYRGIHVNGAPLKLINSKIRNNNQIGLYIYDRSNYASSTNEIIGNTFDGNEIGIYVDYDPVLIENNNIVNNRSWAIHYTANYQNNPVLKGNTIRNNGYLMVIPATALPDASNTIEAKVDGQAIELRGQNLTADTTFYRFGTDEIPVDNYVVHNSNLNVPKHLVMEVKPGVNIKFANNLGLDSYGALIAEGLPDRKITFTTINDDLAGGDTNRNGGNTSPVNGNWRGIKQYSSTLSRFTRLNNVIIRYSGYSGDAGLYLNGVSPVIENLEVSNSSSYGVRLYDASPSISGSFIWGNDNSGIYIERSGSFPRISFSRIASNGSHGVDLYNGAKAEVTNSDIFGNRSLGLSNRAGNTVLATQNWWGDIDGTGPYQETDNPKGSGQTVSSNVDFVPFKDKPSIDYVYTNFQAPEISTVGNVQAPEILQGTLSNEWDSGKTPGKTMVYDKNKVALRFPALNPEKRYKIRATYFNGDPSLSVQSLTDGSGNVLHEGMAMPAKPTSYQFSIPKALYSTGNLELQFVHDNAETSIRGALSELWLLEDSLELSPPKFREVKFNDKDGDGVASLGDEYSFVFSEALDTSLLTNGSTEANSRLVTETGTIWGINNQLHWSADESTVTVQLTEGFTVVGNEQVLPKELTDQYNNLAVGVQSLTLKDTVPPKLVDLEWTDFDNNGYLSIGDSYNFVFDEVMDQSVLKETDKQSANAHLRPEGGLKYGAEVTPVWSDDGQQVKVTVTVTEGFSILGDELIQPSKFIQDVAGNSAVGTVALIGRDLTAPAFVNVLFEDADGNGATSLGDAYTFIFSEPMKTAAVSDQTKEANRNLAPADAVYGLVNKIKWNDDFTRVTVVLTDGFTVRGNETVQPGVELTDISGNSLIGVINLNTEDRVKPSIKQVKGTSGSPVPVSTDFRVTIQFSSSMDQSEKPDLILQTVDGDEINVPSGEWRRNEYPADTYITGIIPLDSANRNEWALSVRSGQDIAGNSLDAVDNIYRFRVQEKAPGIDRFELAPVIHQVTNNRITLSGQRPENTEVWMNGIRRAPKGSGNWQFYQTLNQGINRLELMTRDEWGENSAKAVVLFDVDSIAPNIEAVYPTDNSWVNTSPEYLRIAFREEGSGIDWEKSQARLTLDEVEVAGQWSNGVNAIEFIPHSVLLEGDYLLIVELHDIAGLDSGVQNYRFHIDKTAPEPPGVNKHSAVVTVNFYEFSGTKEAGTRLYVNGSEVVTTSAASVWSYRADLTSGENKFQFVLVDSAGNKGPVTETSIELDDVAPGAVTASVDGRRDGQSALIDWSDYDEVINGNDISQYRVYISGAPFNDVDLATLLESVKGKQSTIINGLIAGQRYHFAVVAVDGAGNSIDVVSSVATTIDDITPPAEVTRLRATSHGDRIVLDWLPPVVGDLSGFVVYKDDVKVAEVDRTTPYHEVTGLERATEYGFNITTIDSSQNESSGSELKASTWLINPNQVVATGLDSRVAVQWDKAEPSRLIKRQFVYIREQAFDSIEGMQPESVLAPGITEVDLTGLENNKDYFVAVAVENTSGGVDPLVSSVAAKPEADVHGPEIGEITINVSGESTSLSNGIRLTRTGLVTVQAEDSSGIYRLTVLIDGRSIGEDSFIADGLQLPLDLAAITDGEHRLEIRVSDALDNVSSQSYDIVVDLEAPKAPVLSSPANGLVTNNGSVLLMGTSVVGTEVQARVNDQPVGNWQSVGGQGRYTFNTTLVDGINALSVVARYQSRSKLSPVSTVATVTLDRSVPNAPGALNALSRAQGEVRLSWLEVEGDLAGYHVYRGTSAFASVTEAGVQRLTSTPVNALTYTDVPMDDGDYVYAVTAMTRAGSESALSEPVTIAADSRGPHAESVELLSNGATADDGRFGQGSVDVTVRFDEPLRNPPFFAFSFGETSIPVVLSKDYNDEQLYTGRFSITGSTPSGTGFLVFQAFDAKGNQGSELVSGDLFQIQVDTQGPEVSELTLNPGHPVANTGNTQVEVLLRLSDDVDATTVPQLIPTLDGEAIAELSEGISLSRDSQSQPGAPLWVGRFTLPSDAGQSAPQQLAFNWQAQDDLGNVTRRIHDNPRFEIYQGELPGLPAPIGLTASARAGGQIALGWKAVEQASAYRIFRQADGDENTTTVADVTELTWLDDNQLNDGRYQYRVASIRQANGETVVGTPGQPVTVDADSEAPGQPRNVQLSLNGAGMVIRWIAPEGTVNVNKLTYNLYRLNTPEGADVDLGGIEPLQTGIPGDAFIALDKEPSDSEHTYTITAVDSAGNESQPATPQYLNAGLLPVSNLGVTLDLGSYPVLNWGHHGRGVSGYDVYRGEGSERIKLNDRLLTTKQFTDRGFNGGQTSDGAASARTYHVVAVDANGVQSLEHTLTLPGLSAHTLPGQTLKRGVMNRIAFRVDNTGQQKASGLQLSVQVQDGNQWRSHQSAFFSVDAGSFTEVPMVIGGYQGLNALSTLKLHLSQSPQPGEQIRIQQRSELTVGDSSLLASLSADTLLRGATGKARFTLENTSDVVTEILMARNSGNTDSSEVRLVLTDTEGNRLGSQAVRQFTGDVVVLSNGDSVARLQPGQRFTSELTTLNIPAGAPDNVRLQLEIDRLHYQRGKPEQVTIGGLRARQDLTLVETDYVGEITSVSHSKVFGSQPITIEGRALLRGSEDSEQTRSGATLDLIFDRRGFEKRVQVTTDAQGQFRYQYQPEKGESGQVRIAATYPASSERPWHNGFLVENASVSPHNVTLRLLRNFPQTIPLKVKAGHDTTLTNLRLEADGDTPQGMTLTLPDPLALKGQQTGYLNLQVSGDNEAEDRGRMTFKVKADNTEQPLAAITVDYQISEARAQLSFRPGNIETGVAQGGTITERLTLSNNSTAEVNNIRLALTEKDGSSAPAWLQVSTGTTINQLAIGDKTTIDLQVAPPDNLAEGNYTFTLNVSSDNAPDYGYPVYVAVTQAGEGSVFFHASDIYTATLDKQGQPIRGLSGARVKLQNEQVLTEVYEGRTDNDGNLLLENIPAGRYQFRASAHDHEDISGRLWIKPGIVTAEEIFLVNNLITVEFNVKEITLEDRYEINLDAEFKTNVPVAVVVIEPMSVNLPVMKKGDIINGEITLTNYGLIRADNVQGQLPTGNDVARFDYLQPIPDTLEAGEVYTLPYRVTALQSFNPDDDGSATGGGCWKHQYWARVNWESQCANGQIVKSGSGVTWYSAGGSCGGSGGGGGTGGGNSVIGGGGGGWGGGISIGNGGSSIGGEANWCPADAQNGCPDGNCFKAGNNDGSGGG